MFWTTLHLTGAFGYVSCYSLLAWHAHSNHPEICVVYWLLALVALLHLLCLARTAVRRIRFLLRRS